MWTLMIDFGYLYEFMWFPKNGNLKFLPDNETLLLPIYGLKIKNGWSLSH